MGGEAPPPVLVEDHLEYEIEDLLQHGHRRACWGVCSKKNIHLYKLFGSMNDTSRALQRFLRFTYAVVESGLKRVTSRLVRRCFRVHMWWFPA